MATRTAKRATAIAPEMTVSLVLAAEIIEGLAEFERGEYIELTPEQLAHAAATGEWPWVDDGSGA